MVSFCANVTYTDIFTIFLQICQKRSKKDCLLYENLTESHGLLGFEKPSFRV